jgi:hypothetical protein
MEFLHGRPLSPEELELIRRQVEEGFEVIAAVDGEIRSIVARNWPHLLSKLPPILMPPEKNPVCIAQTILLIWALLKVFGPAQWRRMLSSVRRSRGRFPTRLGIDNMKFPPSSSSMVSVGEI